MDEGVNGFNLLHALVIGWGLGVAALAVSGLACLSEVRADKRSDTTSHTERRRSRRTARAGHSRLG
jgi:hypothetical protein